MNTENEPDKDQILPEDECPGWGVAHLDPETGRILQANAKLGEITGYAESELVGTELESLVRAEERGEKTCERKDGSVVRVNVDSTVVRGRSGEPVSEVVMVRDISESERTQRELKASLKELADLKFALDESAIVAFTDQRGRITYVNDKFCEVSGYSRYELMGRDHRLINSGFHHKDFIRELWRTIARGRVWRGELRNRAKDGSIYWVDTTIVPFLDERGKPYQYVAIRYEVTDRKKAEEALSEIREAERNRIARDLHDDVLQDLSYALQTVRSLENDGEEAWRKDESLQEVESALDRTVRGLRSAVHDLRLEAGARSFVRSLEDLAELNRQMNPECDLDLRVGEDFPEKLPERTGRELLRIAQEALANARRHSGCKKISVSATVSKDGNLRVEVSDDGRGFDPQRTTPGMGTAGMKERTRALSGKLTIESAPEGGARVVVEIPGDEVAGSPREPLPDEARVLLVDDHSSFRQGIASRLSSEPDFEIVGQAGTLAEAREVLASGVVDLAVVDLGLPDGHGSDLIKDLRSSNPKAQAITLSATEDRAEIARAVQSGASGVLHKSSGMDEILDSLRRLRAGEVLIPLEEVIELLRLADVRKEEEYEARRAIESLTNREKEILSLMAEGLDASAISTRLHISAKTERNHAANILSKLGVHSRLQAVVFAARHGAVSVANAPD